MQKRKHPRIHVNLPIACTFTGKKKPENISSIGKVYDLSVGGMKIGVPLPIKALQAKAVNYYLNLPQPFNKIHGIGKIRWVYKDNNINRLYFGMKFSTLNKTQRQDLESIVNEVSSIN